MIGHRVMTMDDYLSILRRRMWWIVVPAVISPVIAFLISLKIPERYTSTTLVLVESQKVPDSFVKPVVNDDLTSRLATMQEQIFSRTRLQPLIEKFGLYKDQVGKKPMEDLVDQIRKSITLIPIRPDVQSARTNGLPGFYVSFTADNPRMAQQVCAEITSMFMTENLKDRQSSAEGTTAFLASQLEDAKRSLDEQDARLAALKTKYVGQLPGQEQSNLSLLTSLNTQLDSVNQSLVRAQQDKTFAESLLAQQTSAWEASQTASNPQDLEKQLSTLQSQLVTLQAKYTEDHPDVIKTKKEIENVKKKLKDADSAVVASQNLKEKKLSANQPAQLQQLRLQVHQSEQFIASATIEQQRLQKAIRDVQGKIQSSPAVEEQFKQASRDYDTARKFYDDLLTKKTQSEMATNLERRQQGEQFRIMDPPNLPERPTFPNRPLITAGGLAGGLALGLGVVFLLEMRDKSIRNEADVAALLQIPTLACVPLLEQTGDHSAKSKRLRKKVSPNSENVRPQHV